MNVLAGRPPLSSCVTCCRSGQRKPCIITCKASKTTRGTHAAEGSSTSTGSSRSDLVPPAQSSSENAVEKGLQGHLKDVGQRLSSLVSYLTPKQEGDAGDLLMMSISMAVFIYLAMQLYRLYYYFYLQLGVMDMML